MRRLDIVGAVAALAVWLAAGIGVGGQDRNLEELVRSYAGSHEFSGTVLVERRGAVLVHQSFGLAERAFGVAATNDTRYRIASITKLFTSTLILQLHDQGRLDLSAPLSGYLPDYPGEGASTITPHQLLTHTSGIRNFDTVRSYEEAATRGMEMYQLPHTSDELLSRYAAGPLVHEPGTTFEYNNADYIILGKIIEALTGQSFAEALDHRLLAPLGLAGTGLARQQDITDRLAPTYYRPDGKSVLLNDLPVFIENWYAAGGMYGTAKDLLTFAQALYGGKLLRAETLTRMLSPGKDNYGYGLWVFDLEKGTRKIRVAQRPGSVMGANAVLLRLLDDESTVIILGNTNLTDIDDFSFEIARALVH
jgi:D-alanyl-D-alanine carboxypeptidase